jgi:hypothetical protein
MVNTSATFLTSHEVLGKEQRRYVFEELVSDIIKFIGIPVYKAELTQATLKSTNKQSVEISSFAC